MELLGRTDLSNGDDHAPTTTTDENGNYYFGGLPTGDVPTRGGGEQLHAGRRWPG